VRWDTLIVGGGSAGCALAGRLSEDPGHRVLLLEAGPAFPDEASYPAEVRDVTSLAGADAAYALNWAHPTELAAGRPGTVARGRVLGGSSAINGAYHVRATPADVDAWPGWSYADAVAAWVRSEDDHDFDGPAHGGDGPVPVERPAGELLAGVTQRVIRGAAGLGVPVERDKNAGGPPGVGLVPANAVRGMRVNAAMAYVLPVLDRPNLTVRGDTPVARVLLDGTRAVGVETVAGERLEAGEVVLCAGAVKSPQLLALSGSPWSPTGPGSGTAGATTRRCSWGSATTSRCTRRPCRHRPPCTSTPARSTRRCRPTPRATSRCCSSPGRSPPAARGT
jgi:choline dehydrogenase